MEHDQSHSIEVAVSDTRWYEAVADPITRSEQYALAAIGLTKRALDQKVELSVVLASDQHVHELNHQYRGIDRSTNVLSFPLNQEIGTRHLGDVVLAFETIKREAQLADISIEDHLAHLIVHGTLHLLGWDHDDPEGATKMEAEEIRILASLGVSDPYLGRVLA